MAIGGDAVGPHPVAVPGRDVGDREQHARWLPADDRGRGAGGVRPDRAARRLRRRRDPDPRRAGRAGRFADGYRLTGTKIWISNAPEADRYLVFATLDPAAGAEGDHRVPRREGHARVPVRGARARRWGSGRARRPSSSSTAPWCRPRIGSARRARATGSRCRRWPRAGSRSRRRASGWPAPALEQAARVPRPAAGVRRPARRAAGPPVHGRRDGPGRGGGTGADPRRPRRAKDRGEPIGEASSLAKWTASDTAMQVATDAVQLFGGARLFARDRDRAPDARREGRPDLRGHEPDPPPDRRRRGLQAGGPAADGESAASTSPAAPGGRPAAPASLLSCQSRTPTTLGAKCDPDPGIRCPSRSARPICARRRRRTRRGVVASRPRSPRELLA